MTPYRLIAAFIVAWLAVSMTHAQTTFELISVGNGGTLPSSISGSSSQPAITPDGRYVVFSASATGLVPGVTNNQVYLRDRVAGTIELISQSTAGTPANANDSSRPSISNDGCRVVFQSWADNLVVGDTNASSNVFVRNRCTNPKTTEMVDVFSNGSPGTAQGMEARISGDGRKVVFVSWTQNLVAGLKDHNGNTCGLGLYVRDLDSHTTTALMRPDGGCLAGNEPDLTFDGSKIVFWSNYYPAYLPNDTNLMWDIYLYDLKNPTSPLSIVSTNKDGSQQHQDDGVHGGESISAVTAPAISQDGRMVAFRSNSYGLVPSLVTRSGISQLYVKDLFTGKLEVASVDSSGAQVGDADSSNLGTKRPALSQGGDFVVFATNSTNLATETGGIWPNTVLHYRWGGTIGFTDKAMTPNWSLPEAASNGRYLVVFSGQKLDPSHNSPGYFLIDLGWPSAPVLTRLVAGNGKIKVFFNPPSDPGNSPLDTYSAICEAEDGTYGYASGGSSPLTVNGLKNGVKYLCSVLVWNSTGPSPSSNSMMRRAGSSIVPLMGIILN